MGIKEFDLSDKYKYIICGVFWTYNDCWYERDGVYYTPRIYDDPWEATIECRELNYKFGLERLNELNRSVNYSTEFEYSKGFIKEDQDWKIVETENEHIQEDVGRILMELGLNGYEVVQIPSAILKDNNETN